MDFIKKELLIVGLLTLALTPCANAMVVYSNGGPNQNGANGMTDFLQSDDFNLTSSTSISSVTFWNLQLLPSDYLGSLFWAIQADVGGNPGATIAFGSTSSVTREVTGLQDKSGTYIEFINTFDIPLMQLAGGSYWLTLHDGPLGAADFTDFYWEWSSDIGNGQEFDLIANADWDSNFADHAFILSVPEPSPTSLLLSGMVIVGFAMRKSQKWPTRTQAAGREASKG